MHKLDSQTILKKKDFDSVYASITLLGDQLISGWQQAEKIKIPASYLKCENIVLSGMGGSQLGADIIRAIFFKKLKKPFTIMNGYDIPASVNKKTLFIASSYSGSTEEVLSSSEQAKRAGGSIVSISGGGALSQWAQKNKIPFLSFITEHNPSHQPRMGVGYSIGILLCIFSRMRLIPLTASEFVFQAKKVKDAEALFGIKTPVLKNPAKKIAADAQDKNIMIIASEFLSGNAHVLANQINENCKVFSSYFLLPEINHHLLEGLRFPKINQKKLLFVFLDSGLYHKKIQLRLLITKTVLTRQHIAHATFSPKGTSELAQVFETLAFGSYFSFYLTALYGINPVEIPWVDFFKAELKKKN